MVYIISNKSVIDIEINIIQIAVSKKVSKRKKVNRIPVKLNKLHFLYIIYHNTHINRRLGTNKTAIPSQY